MAHPPPPIHIEDDAELQGDDDGPAACVMVFNANDASGAGGIGADITAMSSVGVHVLPVVTGVYARDTTEIVDHFALDDEAVTEQARTILEDLPVQVFKVGFVGTPENISAISELVSDYAEVPVITHMPDLSWWREDAIDQYLDACAELLLPQTTLLVGNYQTLTRWLLPEWSAQRNPTARDIAIAAHGHGVAYTLVTGIPLPDQFIENALCSPTSVIRTEKYERLEAQFAGAGDTLSAALAALIATDTELGEATSEALSYLDRCLEGGFRPGMGLVQPDRLFWAHSDDDEADESDDAPAVGDFSFELPPGPTRH